MLEAADQPLGWARGVDQSPVFGALDWRPRQDSNLWPLPSEGSGVARPLLGDIVNLMS
jgi:hypothetical protein